MDKMNILMIDFINYLKEIRKQRKTGRLKENLERQA